MSFHRYLRPGLLGVEQTEQGVSLYRPCVTNMLLESQRPPTAGVGIGEERPPTIEKVLSAAYACCREFEGASSACRPTGRQAHIVQRIARRSAIKVRDVLSLVVSVSLMVLLQVPPVAAQDCHWDGTAPFCSGECGLDETEMTRLDAVPDFWIPPFVIMDPPFGKNCVTGTKALCCATTGITCRWDGTAPFCDGECRSNERVSTPPAGSSSGASCWTGSKVYCCSTTSTGSVGARLEAASELTRYAALWTREKGPVWQARHGLSTAEYQQVFDNLAEKGYRPVEVNGYSVGGQARYAAIWEQREGPAWVARHGMLSDVYQEEFFKFASEGYRLERVSGYHPFE